MSIVLVPIAFFAAVAVVILGTVWLATPQNRQTSASRVAKSHRGAASPVSLRRLTKPSVVKPTPIKYDAELVLSAAELDRVTGAYKMPDGRVTSVRRDGGKLFVQMTGLGGQAELMPESASTFFIPGFDSVLTFDLPATGPAHGVAMKVNGIEIRAVRQ